MPLQGKAVPWLVPLGHLGIAVAEGLDGFSSLMHLFVRLPRALVGTYRAVYLPLEVGMHLSGAAGYYTQQSTLPVWVEADGLTFVGMRVGSVRRWFSSVPLPWQI